jgi:hypothetical protein
MVVILPKGLMGRRVHRETFFEFYNETIFVDARERWQCRYLVDGLPDIRTGKERYVVVGLLPEHDLAHTENRLESAFVGHWVLQLLDQVRVTIKRFDRPHALFGSLRVDS